MFSKHKNKNKKLLVGLALVGLAVLTIGFGVGVVSADEPTEESVLVVTYEDAAAALGGQLRTDCPETAIATDEDGTPVCEDWCSTLDCKIPCKRLQVTQRPIAHWQGFHCVVLEGSTEPTCVSGTCAPCPGDEPAAVLPSWYAGSVSRWSGRLYNSSVVRVGGASNSMGIFVVRASALKDVSTVEDVMAVLSNTHLTAQDGAVATLRVDILFLGWSRNWENWTYYTWVDLHSHISGTVARIDTDYIREYMVPGDGLEVESVELRALVARVADDVKAYARLSSTPAWVAFRVTLEGPNEDVSVQFGSWPNPTAEVRVWEPE